MQLGGVSISNNSVKHHYIPQFFLNNFGTEQTNHTYSINVFNKNNFKKFSSSTNNIGYIKKFHTIDLGNEETDIFEKLHNDVYEKIFSKKYDRILYKLSISLMNLYCYNCLSNEYYNQLHFLEHEDKAFLSKLLAYFIQRGKKYRVFGEEAYESGKKMHESISIHYGIADKKEINDSYIKQMGTKEDIKIHQLNDTFFDREMLNKITKYLFLHTWNVCFNLTDTLFYTNDNAHALATMWKEQPKMYGIGYTTPGNYISFPLTPRIAIIMYDPPFLEKNGFDVIDCNFVKADYKFVEQTNTNIIYSAIDEVYSSDNNWVSLDRIYKKFKIQKGHKPYSID